MLDARLMHIKNHMNDIITSIIEYIDSHLAYKFKRKPATEISGSAYISNAIVNDAVESVELCGQMFCFIMQGDDIIVSMINSRDTESTWQRHIQHEILECYKFNICDNITNGIDKVTAMMMLQELKHLSHDKEDLILDRLLDSICLADKRFKKEKNTIFRINSRTSPIIFKPKMIYPRYKGKTGISRLLCIEHYSENSKYKSSVSFNFDDVRCFKRIIKWLSKDKFISCSV